jgi:hypothetical protein
LPLSSSSPPQPANAASISTITAAIDGIQDPNLLDNSFPPGAGSAFD